MFVDLPQGSMPTTATPENAQCSVIQRLERGTVAFVFRCHFPHEGWSSVPTRGCQTSLHMSLALGSAAGFIGRAFAGYIGRSPICSTVGLLAATIVKY